jgi:cell division protein FtsL
MAACTTNYFGENCVWPPEVAEWNRKFFERQHSCRRGARTPEFYFPKHFDNSRLVKAPDPARARQMRIFCGAIALLFSLVMIYGLQHFSAIEGGYKVEAEKQMLDKLREENRQLRLAEAQLTEPGRIDSIARQMGLADPQPDQVVHPNARPDAGAPVVAQAIPPALVTQ